MKLARWLGVGGVVIVALLLLARFVVAQPGVTPNNLRTEGSALGASTMLRAFGLDTNISITCQPKAAGQCILVNPVISGFTAGSVIFAGASGALSQDNANFFWDAANMTLSIGSNTPTLGGVGVSIDIGGTVLTIDPVSGIVTTGSLFVQAASAMSLKILGATILINPGAPGSFSPSVGSLSLGEISVPWIGAFLAAPLSVVQGTLTGASTPFITHTATWNNGATVFVDHLVNITNTASAVASRFVEYQRGGALQFAVTSGATTTGLKIRTAQQTVPTCTTNCGAAPTVTGTDTAALVTLGAGPANAFVIVFNGTWTTAAPACVVQQQTSALNFVTKALVSTTQITVSVAAGPTAGDVFSVVCIGTA